MNLWNFKFWSVVLGIVNIEYMLVYSVGDKDVVFGILLFEFKFYFCSLLVE